MLIYKDILTDVEIISDIWDMKEVDGIVYEADIRNANNRDEAFDIGANPSVEEAKIKEMQGIKEEIPEDAEAKFDIEEAFHYQKRLQDKDFKKLPQAVQNKAKKEYYRGHIKAYMKRVAETLKANGTDEETIKEFQTGASKYVNKIVKNIENYDIYASYTDDPDGMHILLNFREDGVTPFVTVWKHGLTSMKV